MSEERKKVEVGFGEKGTPPDGDEIVDVAKPEEEEVGGRRYIHRSEVMCPHCYAINCLYENPDYRMWFRCWNCSGTFQY